MSLNELFFIALELVALMFLAILIKIFIDTKRSAMTRAEYVTLEIERFVNMERRKCPGERNLCTDCKLQQWFKIGNDGEIVIKVPGTIEVYDETLLFKGKVPQ
jgi:hypothetical protein